MQTLSIIWNVAFIPPVCCPSFEARSSAWSHKPSSWAAGGLLLYFLYKTRPLSQLPETKNTAAIKQQPVKGFKNLHLGVTTEYGVQTEAEGRAQAQGMGWQHSSVRLEGPVAVAVTQPERQLG